MYEALKLSKATEMVAVTRHNGKNTVCLTSMVLHEQWLYILNACYISKTYLYHVFNGFSDFVHDE